MLAALQRRILHSCQRADLAIAPRDFIDLAHYRHNDSEANYAPYPYLAQLAERLFGAQGGGNALICGEQMLTYRELGQRIATAIANLQNRGVQPGNVVALYLPRSPEQIILSLACALQGVIWVPVDINSPPERTAYLLENCRPTLVVHGGDLETPIGVTPATLLAPTDRTPALPDEQTLVERSASRPRATTCIPPAPPVSPNAWCSTTAPPPTSSTRPSSAGRSPPTTSSFPSRRRTMTCRCSICSVRCAPAPRWCYRRRIRKRTPSAGTNWWKSIGSPCGVRCPRFWRCCSPAKRPIACVRYAGARRRLHQTGDGTNPAYPAPGSRAVLARRTDRNHHLEHLAPDRPAGERHRALRPPAAGQPLLHLP